MRRHVSVPEREAGPVEVQAQQGVVLPQAREHRGGQGGGELQVLVREQQRSHSGVQAGQIVRSWGQASEGV